MRRRGTGRPQQISQTSPSPLLSVATPRSSPRPQLQQCTALQHTSRSLRTAQSGCMHAQQQSTSTPPSREAEWKIYENIVVSRGHILEKAINNSRTRGLLSMRGNIKWQLRFSPDTPLPACIGRVIRCFPLIFSRSLACIYVRMHARMQKYKRAGIKESYMHAPQSTAYEVSSAGDDPLLVLKVCLSHQYPRGCRSKERGARLQQTAANTSMYSCSCTMCSPMLTIRCAFCCALSNVYALRSAFKTFSSNPHSLFYRYTVHTAAKQLFILNYCPCLIIEADPHSTISPPPFRVRCTMSSTSFCAS